MNAFLRKLGWLRRRADREAELREELQFHLDEEADERREDGLTSADARRAARRDFGNLARVAEETREAWGWIRLEQLVRDVEYGLRQTRRHRSFSAIAIATLALGIGGVAAMFSAFDAVLLRPLPYADADRLVMIWLDMGNKAVRARHDPTPAEWIEWRRLNTVFSDVALTQAGATTTLSGDGDPEQVPVRRVSWNFWSVLGVQPAHGRVFTEDEDNHGTRVALISHALWQRRYGGAPDVVGRRISINDTAYEVIGVMPPQFYFLPSREIDLWLPTSLSASIRRNFSWHDAHVVGRLKPGVTVAQASESMRALSLQVTAKDFRGPHAVHIVPLRDDLAGRTQNALVLLLAASGAVLLIACVNLANLLLSRSASRGREIAVRTALGASRPRLVAQFLTESLVLAAFGTLAGLALALPVMRFLERLIPEAMGTRLVLDWRVLSFSAAAGITAALAFGLAPAWRGSRSAPQTALRDGGRGTVGSRSHWFRHALIVLETALAVVLLTCGGLLLQTFQHLRNTDIGMNSERLLTFETPKFRYPDLERRVAAINAEVEKVRGIPGVIAAASINFVPFTNVANATFYLIEGQPRNSVVGQVALIRNVSRDYFATVGAQLREGRSFDISDRTSSTRVAIVNEPFARRQFAGRSALGQRFKFGNLGDKGHWFTIVGVVNAIPESGVLTEPRPVVYRLYEHCEQIGDLAASIVVRTAVEPSSIVPAVRQAIWSIDKNQPVARIRTLDEIIDRQLSTPSQSSTLLGAFALLALLLASLGMYGVLSHAVSERTNEIGVRMALGATSGQILRSFGLRGLLLTLVGLGIGLALGAIAARSLDALLFGFRPAYAPTGAAVALILLAVAALACFVPARRASRVDPVVALRSE
jgi:putative ABC transport system permease protein